MKPSRFELSPISTAWSTFWAMTRKELIIMIRYPVEFVASFGRIFLMVAIFSLSSQTFTSAPGNQGAESPGDYGVGSGVVVYGFILFMFLSDTLWTIGYNIRREQIWGTLEQLYLSPASKFLSLVSRVTNTLLWTGALSVAASALMILMIGRLPVENPLFGLYLLLMTLAGTFGFGFAFAALTLHIKDSAQVMANLLQFSFLVLCANFFPFSALPPILRSISRLIPLSYGVDAFRSAMMGYPEGFPELASTQMETLIVTLFGVIMPILGYLFYRWSEERVRRTGDLSAY
jgi:ABC-2 type transport system permease protein